MARLNEKTDFDDPAACALRALSALHEAERIFPFAGPAYTHALGQARRAIGEWSVGMVADMERDVGTETGPAT